jgi:hypothetical protein
MPILIRNSRDALIAILKTLQKAPDTSKTWGCTLALSVTLPAVELYFLAKYAGDIKLQTGQTLYMPRFPFRRIILLNEGNADMMWDINYKPGDQQQTCTLRALEDIQIDAEGEEKLFSFSARAIPAGGPSPGDNILNWGGDQNTAHLRMVCIT